jgi:hypothetical protein
MKRSKMTEEPENTVIVIHSIPKVKENVIFARLLQKIV